MHEYDLIADWYAKDRRIDTNAVGVPEVRLLASTLPAEAAVLDVGCGNGLPLTKLLVEAGFTVVGVDSSPKMLEKFRANLPATLAICSPIQSAMLPDEHFDAAISWGVLFHLPHAEQSLAIQRLASVLKTGGKLLFTSGDRGDRTDDGIQGEPMNGVPFHYWSLTPDGYRSLLAEHGLVLLDVHQDQGKNTYYLAEKTRGC
jgi:SAM-dependent methyltransferase